MLISESWTDSYVIFPIRIGILEHWTKLKVVLVLQGRTAIDYVYARRSKALYITFRGV